MKPTATALLTLAAASLALAGPAHALSCLAPSVESSFTRAAEAEELYAVVLGEISYDAPEVPQQDPVAPQGWSFPAQLSGTQLGRDGFETPFDQPITIEVACVAAWCGGLPEQGTSVSFVEKRGEDYVLVAGACPWSTFPAPDAAQVETLEACMAAGGC